MFYNEKENVLYCLMEAPDKDALSKHYEKGGVKYDWMVEVKTTKWLRKTVVALRTDALGIFFPGPFRDEAQNQDNRED